MDMTRKNISLTSDPRDIFFYLSILACSVSTAVASAIFERTSGTCGSEPSSRLKDKSLDQLLPSSTLKVVTGPSFCPFTLISHWYCLSTQLDSFYQQRICTSKGNFSFKSRPHYGRALGSWEANKQSFFLCKSGRKKYMMYPYKWKIQNM